MGRSSSRDLIRLGSRLCRDLEAEGAGSTKPSREEQPTVYVGEQHIEWSEQSLGAVEKGGWGEGMALPCRAF